MKLDLKTCGVAILNKERNTDELVNLVSQKTGLNKEMSEQAVKVVLDFLKKKLPAPVAAQVDLVLKSGSAADALGGLFGGKKKAG